MNKINWKRLFHAMGEALLTMLAGLVLIVLVFSPIAIAFITNSVLWMLLYVIIFFIGETWEKYNGR
jgi:uncharacterized membrane protein